MGTAHRGRGRGGDGRAGRSRNGPANSSSRLLTEEQVAQRWGFAVKTLQSWRAQRRGPKFVRFSQRMVRYRVADIEAFIKDREVEPEAAARR